MPVDDLQERLSRLTGLLAEAVALLDQYGESPWAAWLATSKREIAAPLTTRAALTACSARSEAWAASTMLS